MKKLLLVTMIILTGCASIIPVKQKFPEAPKELLQQCPDLKQTEPTSKLSEVLKVVTDNYSQYHECQLEVETWIEWYNTQKHIFDSVK
jgi:hypothetical protein